MLNFNDLIVNPKLDLDLLRAILQRSAAGVRAALGAGADPNASFNHAVSGSKRTQSALMLALLDFGQCEIAEVLLSHGANLETRTTKGKTALHLCAQNLKPFEMEWLLKNGANIMAQDFYGRTALMLASKKGWHPLLNMLFEYEKQLKFSGMVNDTDDNNRTAVDYAIWFRKDPCREILELEKSNNLRLITEQPAQSSFNQAEPQNSYQRMPQRRAITCALCAKENINCDKAVPSCSRCTARGLICEPRSTRRTSHQLRP